MILSFDKSKLNLVMDETPTSLTRRSWLRLAGLGTAAAAAVFPPRRVSGQHADASFVAMEHAAHTVGPVGRVSAEGFNPTAFVRSWNVSNLAPEQRAR